jgi:hypothetical protein
MLIINKITMKNIAGPDLVIAEKCAIIN